MAILSNVNGKFAVDSTGAIQFSGSAGTSGYILRSNGNAAPTWVDSSTVIGGPYLPLTGGTLSGALAGTSATFSGILTAQSSSSGDYVRLYGASGTGKWDIYGNGANLRISDNESAGILAVDRGATFGGSVGIGGSSTTNYPLTLRSKSGDYTKILDWGTDVGGSWGTMQISMSAPYATELRSGAWNFAAGNVGIGTGSPDSLLVVQADAHNEAFAGKRSATEYLWFLRNENNSGRFQLYNSSSNHTIEMTAANGRINQAQMIAGTAFALTSNGYATFGSTSSSVPIAFAIDGDGSSPEMFIKTDGNVGIGTDSPVSTWLNTFDPTTGNGTFKLTSEGWIVTPYLTGLAAYYPGQGARPIMWSDVNGTNIQSWDNDASDGISLRSSNGSTKLIVREDGKVGIGTTVPANKLDVKISTSNRTTLEPVMSVSAEGSGPYTGFGPKISFSSNIYYGAATGNPAGIIETAYIGAVMGVTYATNSDLVFATRDGATSVTEKMRITGAGYLLASNTGTYYGVTNLYHQLVQTTGDQWSTKISNDTTLPYGLNIKYVNSSPNNANHQFLYCADSSAVRFYVNSNGGIGNFSSNNVNISDERVKNNIENSGDYLNKICSIPVRLFNYKDEEEGTPKNLGVIAQEVEAIAPELVSNDGFGETPEDGIPLKSVYSTDMMYAMMKAIQELEARIKELENK